MGTSSQATTRPVPSVLSTSSSVMAMAAQNTTDAVSRTARSETASPPPERAMTRPRPPPRRSVAAFSRRATTSPRSAMTIATTSGISP